jgi:hypothetical protein
LIPFLDNIAFKIDVQGRAALIIYEEANSIIVSIEQRFLRVVVMLVIPGFNICYVFKNNLKTNNTA